MARHPVTTEALVLGFSPEAAALLGRFARATTRRRTVKKIFPLEPCGLDVTGREPKAPSPKETRLP